MRPNFFIADDSCVSLLSPRIQLGDILLFQRHVNDGWERSSQKFQRAYYPQEGAIYGHAALYLGAEKIIHAVPRSKGNLQSGVQIDDLRATDICIGKTVCALRWPSLTPAQAITLAICHHIRYNYIEYDEMIHRCQGEMHRI